MTIPPRTSTTAPSLPPAAEWTARITFAVMAIGMLARSHGGDDSVFGALWASPPDGLDWSETSATAVSRAGAATLCAAGVALLWPRSRLPLVFVAIWTSLLMLTAWHREPLWPALVPGETSARWLGALALLLWLPATRRTQRLPTAPRLAEFLFRSAAAATFACHGLKALWLKGEFLDYLFLASSRLLGTELPQTTAEQVLTAIGVVDLTVAGVVLLGRWPPVAGWMAFWGLITALARIVHHGWPNWPEAALRAPNFGVPMILMIVWMANSRARRDDGSAP